MIPSHLRICCAFFVVKMFLILFVLLLNFGATFTFFIGGTACIFNGISCIYDVFMLYDVIFFWLELSLKDSGKIKSYHE